MAFPGRWSQPVLLQWALPSQLQHFLLFLLKFLKFLLTHGLSLSQSCWTAVLPCSVLTCPVVITSLVSPVNMLNVLLVTSFQVTDKGVKQWGARKNTCNIHLFLASREAQPIYHFIALAGQ